MILNNYLESWLSLITMKVDNDVKLDFSDVLIRPKRSKLVLGKKLKLLVNLNLKIVDKNGKAFLLFLVIWIL